MGGSFKNKIILLVEDEAIIAIAQKKSLEKYCYKVITADTGEKALEIFKNNKAIDLVLMDIDLGRGIDGPDTATKILEERVIPVVFLSSHTEPEIVEKTEKITSYGYVVKNSGITVLDASIKMAFKLFDANIYLQNKEKEMKESEEKYRLLHEQAGIAIVYFTLDGTVISYNASALKYRDYQIEDVAGKSVYDLYPKDQADRYMDRISKQISSDTNFEYEELVTLQDGEKWFSALQTRICNEEGKPVGVQIIFKDISECKRAEEMMKKSVESLLTVIDSIEALIYVADMNTYELILVNKYGRRIWGDDLAGQKCWKVFQSLDGPCSFCTNDRLLTPYGKPAGLFRCEFQNRFNGRWYDCHDCAIAWTDGRLVRMEMATDITERKKTEDLLRESEEKYHVIFNNKHYAICIFDLENSKLIDVNHAFVDMYGYGREDLFQGITVQDLTADKKLFDESLDRVKTEGAVFIPLRYHLKKDGTVFPVEIVSEQYELRGRKVIFAMIHDISIRKHAEEALRESDEKIHLLLNSAAEAIYGIDMNGNCTFCNQSCLDMLGYKHPDDLLGKNMHWQIHSRYRDGTMFPVEECRIFQAFRKGVGTHADDEVLWRSDGTSFPAEYWSYPQFKGGETVGSVVTFLDITERKLAGDRIKALLAEKDLILKEVHHRMKNFMNNIQGILMLQADSHENATVVSALNDATHRVQSMSLLYDKLFTSVDFTGVSVKAYLSTLIDEIAANFSNSKSVAIVKNMDDLVLDVKKLQPIGIIVNELITNIMKYAFKGREDGIITVSLTLAGNRISLVISDNGVGIPDSVSFENSTGFGMQLVSILAVQVGADISIERGEGTKFILEFGI